MTSIRSFLHKIPAALCRQFVERHAPDLRGGISWDSPDARTWRGEAVSAIEEAPASLRHKMELEVERICGLADEAGETAMRSIATDRAALEALPSNASRALSLLLNDITSFRHAEEIRYTDEHRRGRSWSGFQGPADVPIQLDSETLGHLKQLVRDSSPSRKVQVEVYERTRIGTDDHRYRLLQVTIYSEGWPDLVKEFEGEELQERTRRPVYEAAITYEPESGAVEVVGKDKQSREELATLFSKAVLGVESNGEPLPLRQYDLSCLRDRHEFPRDANDRIESVRVILLRLMPNDTADHRLVLEATTKSKETIWEMADHRLGSGNPLNGPWQVAQARLSISFLPDEGARRGKILPITITMPHRCDLKDRTARERVIGKKYLERWGLLKHVG